MLPRSLRLSREGFEGTRGLLRRSSPHFAISYVATQSRGGSGIIVPKKVVKGAVARHLLKRRIRAVVREWSRRDRILIISVRKGAQTLTYAQLQDELSSLLRSIIGEPTL